MRSCFCVNQCPGCGQCCQVACGHRGSAGTWTTPNTSPLPSQPQVGRIEIAPLSPDDIRQIIREEIRRAKDQADA